MLIRNARIWQGPLADLRVEGSRIAEVGDLSLRPGEPVIDAAGGLLLPGLHDHHIHLAATLAARDSVQCGPPAVTDEPALAQAVSREGSGWLRGIGYHESIAGMLRRDQLDQLQPERPLRIQHRSGRMWFFNSAAIAALQERAELPDALDRATGRLFDGDDWLRKALVSSPPDLSRLSRELAMCGVTGVTDMSPSNGKEAVDWLAAQQSRGQLLQSCIVAGRPELSGIVAQPGITIGPVKLHLHEQALPPPDDAARQIAAAHHEGRPVAIHCVTETELVFALAAFEAAGSSRGDRIEHAGIASDELVAWIAALDLHVVSQPHFILERGDRYLLDVPENEHGWLYRLRAFRSAGVTLAAGSDAPFGQVDPWLSMQAAVARRTASGATISEAEALTPEQALALFLADPVDLGRQRRIEPGATADLCLLDRGWEEARSRLSRGDVRCTFVNGRLVHDRVDQAPLKSLCSTDAAA